MLRYLIQPIPIRKKNNSKNSKYTDQKFVKLQRDVKMRQKKGKEKNINWFMLFFFVPFILLNYLRDEYWRIVWTQKKRKKRKLLFLYSIWLVFLIDWWGVFVWKIRMMRKILKTLGQYLELCLRAEIFVIFWYSLIYFLKII